MRFLGISLLTLSVTVLGGLLGGSSVNAQSVYDAVYRTTDTLEIHQEYYTDKHNINISTDWITLLLGTWDNEDLEVQYRGSSGNPANQSEIDEVRNAWANASNWTVSQLTYSSGDKEVKINFTTQSSGLSLNWNENYVRVMNTEYEISYSGNIGGTESDNRIVVNLNASTNNNQLDISRRTNYLSTDIQNYVAYVDNPNYPPDYDGEPIRDTVVPVIETGYIPNWVVRFNGDWEVEVFDIHFFTFDDYPFLCGQDGFAPTIDYSIYEKDDPSNVLYSGTISASGFMEIEFPEKYGEVSEYEITGIYNCEGYSFHNYGTHPIRFNRQGGQQVDNLIQNCLKDEFPFVDYNECIASIEEFINALYFTNVTFANEWTGTEGCYELAVLHTWLHLEPKDRVLCPQFSSTVRSIVTPFITFFLGMVMVSFLVRRTHNSYESDL